MQVRPVGGIHDAAPRLNTVQYRDRRDWHIVVRERHQAGDDVVDRALPGDWRPRTTNAWSG